MSTTTVDASCQHLSIFWGWVTKASWVDGLGETGEVHQACEERTDKWQRGGNYPRGSRAGLFRVFMVIRRFLENVHVRRSTCSLFRVCWTDAHGGVKVVSGVGQVTGGQQRAGVFFWWENELTNCRGLIYVILEARKCKCCKGDGRGG
jgi:hypothetical protein